MACLQPSKPCSGYPFPALLEFSTPTAVLVKCSMQGAHHTQALCFAHGYRQDQGVVIGKLLLRVASPSLLSAWRMVQEVWLGARSLPPWSVVIP